MASIREHARKDGSISLYVLWRDRETGKQTSMSFTSRTAAENMKALLDANGQSLRVVERALEAAAKNSFTVQALLERHLELPLRAAEDTKRKYRALIRDHVTKELGSIPAAKLDLYDLGEWSKRKLEDEKLSRKTLLNVTGLLSAAYKRGVDQGWVEKNPMSAFTLPSDDRPGWRATFLTKAEYDLISECMVDRYKVVTDLLVQSGLRFSEATALQPWDIQDGVISVTKSWSGGSGRWKIGAPKTEWSKREVAIPKALASRVLALAEGDDYLFRNLRGGPLRNADYHQSGWQKAVDKARSAGLRKNPRPHDLRHTHASWLLQEGVPIFVVSRRLGHASIDVTTRVYGHITPQGQKEALAGLERALSR